MKPPSARGFGVDVSVVVHPGNLQPSIGRDGALALSGATEICATVVQLAWLDWSTGICAAPIHTGVSPLSFGLLAGFRDPVPEYVTVLWRYDPVLWTGSYLLRMGEWVRIEAANYGAFSRLVFIRARE